MKHTIQALALAICAGGTGAYAGQIDLTITGFASDDGVARIILMEGVEGYTSVKPVTLVATATIQDGSAHWAEEVPAGTYSIIAHHDSDADGDLNRPIFELPLEPYGYSNGAWTSVGLPAFEQVAFAVGDGTAPQHIHLRTNAFVTLTKILATASVALAVLAAGVTIHRRRALRPVNQGV